MLALRTQFNRQTSRLVLCVAGLLCFLLATSLLAEAQVIYLRNGQIIRGQLVSQDAQKVWIRTRRRVRVIRKSRIRRIAYDTGLERDHAKEIQRQRRKMSRLFQRRLAEALKKERARWQEEQKRKQKRVVAKRKLAKKRKESQVHRENLWRSIVLPGWGQYHRGEARRGYIFGGIFLASAYQWYRADKSFRAVSENLDRTNVVLSGGILVQRSTASIVASLAITQEINDEKRIVGASAGIWQTVMIGAYIINVVDAFLFDPSPLTITTGYEIARGSGQRTPFARAAYSWRF